MISAIGSAAVAGAALGLGLGAAKAVSAKDRAFIAELRSTDREVRAHEAAHLAAAGGLARGVNLSPDLTDGSTRSPAKSASTSRRMRIRRRRCARRSRFAPPPTLPPIHRVKIARLLHKLRSWRWRRSRS